MSQSFKRVLAGLVLIITFFAWYVSIFGIGSMNSAKDALKYGLDINRRRICSNGSPDRS